MQRPGRVEMSNQHGVAKLHLVLEGLDKRVIIIVIIILYSRTLKMRS